MNMEACCGVTIRSFDPYTSPEQACWNAGVDLDEAVGQLEVRRQELRNRGVPSWKTDTVGSAVDVWV